MHRQALFVSPCDRTLSMCRRTVLWLLFLAPPKVMLEVQGHIGQGQKDRDLDKGAYRGGQCLLAADSIDSNGNRNGELEVVASSSERLDHGHLVSELLLAPPRQEVDEGERAGPHDGKVYHHRDEGPEDWSEVVYDVVSLVREEHKDCVQQAKERDRAFTTDDVDEEDCHRSVEHDLEDGVDDDNDGAVVMIPTRKLVPDHDHCDTTSQADHDDTDSVVG